MTKEKEEKNAFDIWAESYKLISKMWEDSYDKLYKPWIESSSNLLEKANELSKEATPNKLKEFYEEWIKTYQNIFGQKIFGDFPNIEEKFNKENIVKLSTSGEELVKIYKSWIEELEENSKNTQELLKGEPSIEKYRQCYEIWTKSYNRIFDDFVIFASKDETKSVFENIGIPYIFFENYLQTSKIWRNYYTELYTPWLESSQKLFEKMIAVKEENPESYKEFYLTWMDTYKNIFGKYMPSKNTFDNFIENSNLYMTMYKSWINTLEKMSKKAEELSKTTNPEAYKEFYGLWIKTYEKAFNNFFDDMPVIGPMKELMEPMKAFAKMYTDMYIKTYKLWALKY